MKRFVEAKIETAVRRDAQLVIAGQSCCAESIYTADWLSASHKDSACKRLAAAV
jgi:hypothetical protein